MPDFVFIATIANSLRVTTDIAKGLREVDRGLQTAELTSKLVDLMNALTDARAAVLSVQEELSVKEQEVRELQEKLDLREHMTYSPPFYWLEKDGKRQGPFCQQYYDSEQRAIRLQEETDDQDLWRCRTCENYFQSGGRRSRQTLADTEDDQY